MKRYQVSFELTAQADLRGSYEWGCHVSGKREAQRWVRELQTAILKQLSLIPKGFPLALEDDEFSESQRTQSLHREEPGHGKTINNLTKIMVQLHYFARANSQNICIAF